MMVCVETKGNLKNFPYKEDIAISSASKNRVIRGMVLERSQFFFPTTLSSFRALGPVRGREALTLYKYFQISLK